MKRNIFSTLLFSVVSSYTLMAQMPVPKTIVSIPETCIKDQQYTGTCWCFSTSSLLETEYLQRTKKPIDLSEMYVVRNIYIEKAINYLLRQGHCRFDEGSLAQDVFIAIDKYGTVPQAAYKGYKEGKTNYDHSDLVKDLKTYMEKVKATFPIDKNWKKGYEEILDRNLGKVPAKFTFEEKEYTPITFAKEVLKFNPKNYLLITSFSHHPYNTNFALEVPDNFSNGRYFNTTPEEMLQITRKALENKYSVLWDTDVSNPGFMLEKGACLEVAAETNDWDSPELPVNATQRQNMFEQLVTTDDHLMHLVGIAESSKGKPLFMVKNSYGEKRSINGHLYTSENYFYNNTVCIILSKNAVSPEFLKRYKASFAENNY